MTSTERSRRGPTRSSFPGAMAGNLLLAASAIGASDQSIQMRKELGSVQVHLAFPASSIRDRRRERFGRLARQWREETQWLSSTTEISMHPAYQAIIGMGDDALPLILQELRSNCGHWYWALKAISNADPVPPDDRGIVRRMKAAWLRWGEQTGKLPG